jgi:hypothetical protein
MMSGVIRGRGQNCSLRVLIILASALIRRPNTEPLKTQKTKPLKHRGREEAEELEWAVFSTLFHQGLKSPNELFFLDLLSQPLFLCVSKGVHCTAAEE